MVRLIYCSGLVLLISGWLGCASTSELAKIIEEKELPKDAPEEFRNDFSVQEATEETEIDPESKKTSEKDQDRKDQKKADQQKEKKPFVFPDRRKGKLKAFGIGEKAVYELTYFGVAAGTFTMTVQPYKMIKKRKVYSLHGRAESSKIFSLFYRVNDSVESFFDFKGLFSHRFQMVLDESKQTRRTLELYDHEKKETFYWNRWNHYKKGYIEEKVVKPTRAFVQDSLSALYYLRMHQFPEKVGHQITFPVVSEGGTWEAIITLVRRETLRTRIGRVNTLVLQVDTKFKGVLKKTGNNYIWLTDDHRHLLVRLDAKVKIGTVRALIKDYERGASPE